MSSWDPYKALLMQRVKVKALVKSNIIQSVCLLGKGRLKESCGLEPRINFVLFLIKKSARTSADKIGVRIRFREYPVFLSKRD